MIEINKKYNTVGTVPRYDRNKQKNTTLLEQFQHMIEINKKYHTVRTVTKYNR
jgi:hypothetical protein